MDKNEIPHQLLQPDKWVNNYGDYLFGIEYKFNSCRESNLAVL